MIYLDNAATTFPKPESVYFEMDKVNREMNVNAGRGAYKLARKASDLICNTKMKIRKLINADVSASVIFAPSVTIAMNQIINGLKIAEGGTIYVSPYEHNAVARPLYSLSKRKRINIKQLALNEKTLEIDIEKVKYDFSQSKPSAVFCTHISNVTGYILPIMEIFEISKEYSAYTILDSAQSLGMINIDVKQLRVDFVAFAGHKTLYGPFGIGGFVNTRNIPLEPYITGGTGSNSLNLEMPAGNESKYEPASSNIVAIAGLNAALDEIDEEVFLGKEKEMTQYLIEELGKISGVKMYLPQNLDSHVGIVSFVIKGMNSDNVGSILDEDYDIAVRTGYHCAPYIHEFLKDQKTLGTVRVALSRFSTKQDIDKLVKAINDIES